MTSTFCGKRLFGYAVDGLRDVVITILSYLVWLHHFFTMGSGANVNAVLRHHDDDHLDPDRREDLQLAVHDVSRPNPVLSPVIWIVSFIPTFAIGGLTGVLLAVPPADFVLHNSCS